MAQENTQAQPSQMVAGRVGVVGLGLIGGSIARAMARGGHEVYAFDLNAIPVLHGLTHLPVCADPSHATGHTRYVTPMALAATAAGADCLEIEVHDNPQCAWSDGAQCLKPEKFAETIANCRKIAAAIGREM